ISEYISARLIRMNVKFFVFNAIIQPQKKRIQQIFVVSSGELVANKQLDYETKAAYSLYASVTDGSKVYFSNFNLVISIHHEYKFLFLYNIDGYLHRKYHSDGHQRPQSGLHPNPLFLQRAGPSTASEWPLRWSRYGR